MPLDFVVAGGPAAVRDAPGSFYDIEIVYPQDSANIGRLMPVLGI